MKFIPSIGPAKAGVILIYQGSTFRKPFTWSLVDNKTNTRTPVDLTGCLIRMQLRKERCGDVLVDFKDEGFISITDPQQGQWEIHVPADISANFTFERGVFDIEVEFPDGEVVRVVEGAIVIKPEVTR